ncbi:MAG: T9SS type A sorting domain-containing protein [Bacteroidetes bacterium]|nr:T9SS type A sorting domain-containing protein [Bacteroidota bacterium]
MRTKLLPKKSFLITVTFVISLLIINSYTFSQPNWSYSITGNSHTILTQGTIPITINGSPISSGDYIGVFFDSTYGAGCGGYLQWTGANNALVAWETDNGGDGFIVGESFKWKIWQASTNYEFSAIATYDNTVAFPNTGFYAPNGISSLTSLVALSTTTSFYIITTDATCYGFSDGIAETVLTSGTPPCSYLWSNGATTSTINNLYAGTYYLTLTDGTGSYFDSAQINEPDQIVSIITVTNVSTFGGSDGELNIQVTGGVPPYSYLWSNGSTIINPIALTAGNYTVTITDNAGCFISEGATINQLGWSYTNTSQNHSILIQDTIPITINGLPISAGDYIGVFFDSTNGAGCGGYIEWNGITNSVAAWGMDVGGDGFMVGESFKWKIWQTSTNTEFVAAATYNTIGFPNLGSFEPNGISSLASLVVGNANTLFYLNSTDATCFGYADGSAETVLIYGTPPYDYLWSNGATTSTINNLSAGTYYLTLTDATGSFIDSVQINEPDQIISTITITNVSTFGGFDGELDIVVSGGVPPYFYNWSNGSTSANLTGLTAGNYTVTVTDNLACFIMDGATVIQPGSTISGQILSATKDLVQSAIVVLYVSANNKYEAIDYVYSDNGLYSFAGIENKDYIVQAFPNFDQYSNLPVYNGGTIGWEQANPLTVDNNTQTVDISLPPATIATNGIGSIGGTVFFDHDSLYEATIFDNEWFGGGSSKSSKSFVVRNIPVFLLNDLGNAVSCVLTDIYGNYQFDDLPYNLYYVNVEKAGFSAEDAEVIVNETNPQINDISFTIIETEIVQNIDSNPVVLENSLSIYPNPVNDFLNIDFSINENAIITISIFDCIGNEIISETSKKTKGEHFIKIKTEDFSNGIYFVKYEIDNSKGLVQLFVK